jgi:hypothetical protein
LTLLDDVNARQVQQLETDKAKKKMRYLYFIF